MNTVNTTENPQTRPEDEDREHLTGRTDAAEDAVDATPDADLTDADASATSRARAEDETSVATTGADGTPAEADGAGEAGSPRTALYVRRRRAPALGFWVLLSFLVPGILALLSVPLFGFGDLRGVVNFVILAMVVIGLPLAAIASFVDARRHRREDRRRG